MSLQLIRNIRKQVDKPMSLKSFSRKEGTRIVYEKKQSMTFDELFEIYPLKSEKNKKLFSKLQLTTMDMGKTEILRSAYTHGLLEEIFKNAPEDALTFFELAKKTVLMFKQTNVESSYQWYKKILTSFWLSHENCPQSLNFWAELKDPESSIRWALEKNGVTAYEQISKKIKEGLIAINDFEDKIIAWSFLGVMKNDDTNRYIKNDIPQVVEKCLNIDNLNHDKISSYITPKEINFICVSKMSKILDIEHFNIPHSGKGSFEESRLNLKELYEFFYFQDAMLKLRKSKEENDFKKNGFDGLPIEDIQSVWDKVSYENQLVNKYMSSFIQNNIDTLNTQNFPKETRLKFWQEVQIHWNQRKMHIDLENKEDKKLMKI